VTHAGRVAPNVSVRVVDEAGAELPWDGRATGELELRGPTITGSYFRVDPAETADKFRDGWLRTGDLGAVHPGGWVQLRDRLKDGIKSGGEWISTVELENALVEHPAVAQVAVIGVPDPRWEERPLVCVRVRDGAVVTAQQLRDFLGGRVPRWWLPERWTFVAELPTTSVGKLDKKQIRASYRSHAYAVYELAPESAS
jgi:Acyl-CoA synthetases (AMP-forming)/AMP-acid ligases II